MNENEKKLAYKKFVLIVMTKMLEEKEVFTKEESKKLIKKINKITE